MSGSYHRASFGGSIFGGGNRAVAALVLALCCVRIAAATTYVVGSDADLVAAADAIAIGTVERTLENAGSGGETVYDLRVVHVLAGDVPASVSLRLPGGVLGDVRRVVVGAPAVAPGESVLVLLQELGDGTHRPVHLGMGIFRLLGSGAEALAVRDLGGAAAYTRRGRRWHRRPAREVRRLADLIASLRTSAGGYEPVEQALLEVPRSLAQSFVLLGSPPSRWTEPDSGRPVVYLLDEAPAARTGLDAARATNQALAAWSAVDCAVVDLKRGGFSAAARFNLCDGRSTILFGDPFDELPDPRGCIGVLGTGGFCSTAVLTEVGGTTFRRITEGDVLVNDGFQGCGLWNEINLAEILTHEVGHTLGLGHSSERSPEPNSLARDATMYFRSHLDGRGAAVMVDDRAGLCTVYPKLPEPDDDTDGMPNAADNCPAVANLLQADRDMDGIGDVCDPLTLQRSVLTVGPPGVPDAGRLHLRALLRLGRSVDPMHETLVLEIASSNGLVYEAVVPAGQWRVNAEHTYFAARTGARRGQRVTLVWKGAGVYILQLRGRPAAMARAPQGALTVTVALGEHDASTSLALRSTPAGSLVFP